MHVAVMAKRDHGDDKDVVVDGVGDAIVADADPETRSTLKRLSPWRARFLTEECDRPAYSVAVAVVNPLQCANCCRTQLDLVCHFQPRSTFT